MAVLLALLDRLSAGVRAVPAFSGRVGCALQVVVVTASRVDSIHPNAVRLAFVHAIPWALLAAVLLVAAGVAIGVLL